MSLTKPLLPPPVPNSLSSQPSSISSSSHHNNMMSPATVVVSFHKSWRSFRRHCSGLRILAFLAFLLLADYYLGLVQLLYEVPFSKFSYPLDADYSKIVDVVQKANGSYDQLPSHLRPITPYDWRLTFDSSLCRDAGKNLFLLMLVKSAARDFQNRALVRHSWGRLTEVFPNEKNSVQVRAVFLLARPKNPEIQERVANESKTHGDIVQYDFIDDYWNNTYKAIMGLRWTAEHCSNARYIFFVDDDYFVNVFAIIDYLKALEPSRENSLYEGYNYPDSRPMRHRLRKWHVTVDEYPYSLFPSFITAGAYLMSQQMVQRFAIAAPFVKFLKFDDVFLGIVAMKLGVKPQHNPNFSVDRPHYSRPVFRRFLALHLRNDIEAVATIWNDQVLYMAELKELPTELVVNLTAIFPPSD